MRGHIALLLLISVPALAQTPAQQILVQAPAALAAPKTRIEQFQAKTGLAVIKGFTDVGTTTGKYGSTVNVTAMEFTDASTGTKQFGIAIEVKASGQYPQTNRSYIDFDEVDSLLNGIDYIGRANKDVTKLANFEATYRTKGDFGITVFSSGHTGNMVAVESGTFGKTRAYFDISELAKLRQLIQKAEAALRSIK